MRPFLPRGKKLKRTRNAACRVGSPSGLPVWRTARGARFPFGKAQAACRGFRSRPRTRVLTAPRHVTRSDRGAWRPRALLRERQGSALRPCAGVAAGPSTERAACLSGS